MEAFPLSAISVADCALVFHWIICFGVHDMITSDRRPQFTSDLWAELCAMINISHHQTTAYHPEANGVVERLHRRLKDVLHACATAAHWVLLGLCSHLREDTGLSPAEADFGTPSFYLTSFCRQMRFLLMKFLKTFPKS
jgi:hypothetical protein